MARFSPRTIDGNRHQGPSRRIVVLGPKFHAAKHHIQSQISLPGSLIDAMAEANFFRLFVPKTIGGSETDTITAFRPVEVLSSTDGSVAWSPFVAIAFSVYSASLPAKVANE